MTETTFSFLKIMFDEHIVTTKFQNMVKEMIIEVLL